MIFNWQLQHANPPSLHKTAELYRSSVRTCM